MNTATSLSVISPTTPLHEVSANPALAALHSSRFFAGLSTGFLSQLAANACLRSFSAGQEIVLEGRWLGAALMVVRGSISAVRRTEGARELTLETFRSDDVLADAIILPDHGLPVDSLVACETSVLLLLPRETFWAATRTIPELSLALAREFERRLVRVKALALGLATSDAESRLYRLILNLARDYGEVGKEGTVIRHFPTQRDLACRIGACRETVCRIVSDLARKNLLSLRGRRLTISPGFFALARAAEAG
jgi:CRP/FNR family cyclic AMP-dependent transcriptional regulator